jgi:hypothetical protein
MLDDENVRVVQAKALQKVADDVKALTKQAGQAGLTPAAGDALMRGFLQDGADLLEMQTDALMTNAVKNKINRLTDLCLDNVRQLAEKGIHSEGSCEKLKDACIYFLRRKREQDACKIAEIFKYMAYNHKELRGFILKLLGMIGCVAMKSKQTQLALQCVDVIMSSMHDLQAGDEEIEHTALDMLQELAAMAGRMRDEAAFNAVISKVAVHYATEKVVLVGRRLEAFLLDLMFIAADRRYVNSLPMLRWISLRLVRNASTSREEQKKFLLEWSVLAAQMANRNWFNETKILLDGIFIFLTREQEMELTRTVLTSLAGQFQMHSQWDGFAGSFKIYKAWHNYLLVVLDRAVLGKYADEEERLDDIRFILRNQRDMLVLTARLTMQEEQVLFHQWLQLWLEENKGNPRRQKRVRRFVQLTAQFWHMTQPKSSKKQWPLLQDIFEPSALSKKYWHYLTQVV